MGGPAPAERAGSSSGVIAVTGGTGFLGSALVRLLREAGRDVALLTRHGGAGAPAGTRAVELPATVHEAAEAIAALFPSGIVHLAARQSMRSSDAGAVIDAGLGVGAAAAVAASMAGVPFVHASSYWQYAPRAGASPRSMYVAAKLAMVPIVRSLRSTASLDARELVLYDSYGPGDTRDKVVPALMRGAVEGRAVHLRAPRATIDLTYVDDVAAAFRSAVLADSWPQTCVVRAPSLISIASLVSSVRSVTGREVHVTYEDPGFRGERKPSGFRWERPPGWQPEVSLESGLLRTWQAAQDVDGPRGTLGAHESIERQGGRTP